MNPWLLRALCISPGTPRPSQALMSAINSKINKISKSAKPMFIQTAKQSVFFLTLSLPESIMETCGVVLTFESVDEILWCDHSNETSSAVLLHGTTRFQYFTK